jgi:hypothetical protein
LHQKEGWYLPEPDVESGDFFKLFLKFGNSKTQKKLIFFIYEKKSPIKE